MPSSHSLPTYASTFVGRAEALAELTRAFERDDARVVTLAGPGGVGKSRLAVHYAAQGHAREACFCDLSTARTADAVCSALARAADLAPGGGGEPEGTTAAAQVGAALAAKGALLVILDNFEAALAHARETVGAWLAAAPQARFLVTSRMPLEVVPGERVVTLAPLATPLSACDDDPGAVGRAESVQLFVDRAYAAGCRLEPSPQLAALVRALDGLPLAIELAAARLRVLTLHELAARLARPFDVLRAPHAGEARHGALWTVLEETWQALADWEQRALTQAAVFEGSFDLEAAEAVVRFERDAFDAPGVLDAVQSLAARGLLRVARPRPDDDTGATRYALYESVRAFARVKLAEHDHAARAASARYRAHFVVCADAWGVGSLGPSPVQSLARLSADYDNLMAVFERVCAAAAADPAEHEPAARDALLLARALVALMGLRSPAPVTRRMCDAALAATAHAPAAADSLVCARVLQMRGWLLRAEGRMEASIADLSRARELAARLGDGALEASLLASLAFVLDWVGRRAEGRAHYEAALALHTAVGNRRGAMMARSFLGLSLAMHDEPAEAEAQLAAALVIAREDDDPVAIAHMLARLAPVLLDLGRDEAATRAVDEGLAFAARAGIKQLETQLLHARATREHARGALDAAAAGYEAARAAAAACGDRVWDAEARVRLALLAAERGELAAGAAHAEAGRALALGLRDARLEGLASAALGAVRALAGEEDSARALLAAAAAALAPREVPLQARAVEALAALCRVAEAERRLRAGDPLGARSALARAAAACAAAAEACSSAARLAARVLARAVEAHRPELAAWWIARDGAWFLAPGEGEHGVVSMAHRASIARMLAALLQHRLDAPGAELSLAALQEAGWPGERLMARSAQNRVHVALSTLRKAGLADLLVRGAAGGYLLEPTRPVRAAAPAPATRELDAAPTPRPSARARPR